jgi:hypothetical protein
MTRSVRHRFWWEAALVATTGTLAVLTAIWHEWIEVLGLDPDRGDGSAEWAVVTALVVTCAVAGAVARAEWRMPRTG